MKSFKKLVGNLLKVATKALGEETGVLYESGRGGRKTIRAIMDLDWQAVDPDSETIISSNQPALGVRLADLPEGRARKGDLFYIEDKTYEVWDVRDDGQGGATLLAHEIEDRH